MLAPYSWEGWPTPDIIQLRGVCETKARRSCWAPPQIWNQIKHVERKKKRKRRRRNNSFSPEAFRVIKTKGFGVLLRTLLLVTMCLLIWEELAWTCVCLIPWPKPSLTLSLILVFTSCLGSETYNRWVRLADSTACCLECQKVDGLTTDGSWGEGWVPLALRKCDHPDREKQQWIRECTRVVR